MKKTLLALVTVFAGALPVASGAAMAATHADCELASGPDLTGKVLAMSPSDSPQQTAKLDFVPQSLFISKGMNLKIFERPNFGGVGILVGRPYDTEFADHDGRFNMTILDNGYYINFAKVKNARYTDLSFPADIASAVCVPAGSLFPHEDALLSLANTFYYPGQTFYLHHNPGRSDLVQATVTYTGGHALLTINTIRGYTPPTPGAGTFDLVNGTITLTLTDYNSHQPTTLTYTAPGANATTAELIAYTGALTLIREDLRAIVADQMVDRVDAATSPVPSLELAPILEVLERVGAAGL